MKYFKIEMNEEGASDSMTFAAERESGAWNQFDALTGGVPRNLCKIKEITEEEFIEANPTDEEEPFVGQSDHEDN